MGHKESSPKGDTYISEFPYQEKKASSNTSSNNTPQGPTKPRVLQIRRESKEGTYEDQGRNEWNWVETNNKKNQWI